MSAIATIRKMFERPYDQGQGQTIGFKANAKTKLPRTRLKF